MSLASKNFCAFYASDIQDIPWCQIDAFKRLKRLYGLAIWKLMVNFTNHSTHFLVIVQLFPLLYYAIIMS